MLSPSAGRTLPLLSQLLLVLAAFTLFFPFASANLFPTTPVQSTVWLAGQQAVVTWSDDGTFPTLDMMGPMVIELWENMSAFVGTLASNVNAKAGSAQVTVPAGVKDNTRYTLCFVVLEPLQITVYSGDFAITPAAAAVPSLPAPASTPSPAIRPPSPSPVTAGNAPAGVPPMPGSGKAPIAALPPVPTDPSSAAALALTNWSAIATAMGLSDSTPNPNATPGLNMTALSALNGSASSPSHPNGHTRGPANGADGRLDMKFGGIVLATFLAFIGTFVTL
ncbi:hypothetical protein BKA83DRAFT_676116 [Pisolithus microcarpus]|nr:hypothetical protein BKA83DRAFT_676116 [Pisolithus microcarpus]